METHCDGDWKLKHPHANKEAHHDTDACSKVLNNVVSITNHNACDKAASSLEYNRCPDNPVVALEEAMLHDATAILPNDAAKERRQERVNAELNVANPDTRLMRAFFEDLFKVNASEARDCGGNEYGSEAN